MASWQFRDICAALWALAVSGTVALADDLARFNAAIEDVAVHNRVAIGYLRTGAVELATLEMARTSASWTAFSERFGKDRPAQFANNPLYVQTLVDVPTRIVGASLMITMGRTDLAGDSLNAIRKQLSALRRASGVEVLADCVLDFNAAMAPVTRWDEAPPDLSRPERAAEVAAQAQAVAAVAKKCDGVAAPELRADPAFRRLIDGTLNALTFIPKAIETRDADMLHRVVGELKAFDHLMTFRYG